MMSDEEKIEFNFNIMTLSWNKSYYGFCYGLRKFYIKEDIPAPETGFKQLLAKQQLNWNYDMNMAAQVTAHVKESSTTEHFMAIL
jgi:hypothetical protein